MGNLSVKTLGYPSFLSQVVPVKVRGYVFSGTMFSANRFATTFGGCMAYHKFSRRTQGALRRVPMDTLTVGFWQARLNADESGALTAVAQKLHRSRNYSGTPAEALTVEAIAHSRNLNRAPTPVEVLSYVAGLVDARQEAPF